MLVTVKCMRYTHTFRSIKMSFLSENIKFIYQYFFDKLSNSLNRSLAIYYSMGVTWTFFLAGGRGQTVKVVNCLIAKKCFLVPLAIIHYRFSFRKKFNLYLLLRGTLPFQISSGEQLPPLCLPQVDACVLQL